MIISKFHLILVASTHDSNTIKNEVSEASTILRSESASPISQIRDRSPTPTDRLEYREYISQANKTQTQKHEQHTESVPNNVPEQEINNNIRIVDTSEKDKNINISTSTTSKLIDNNNKIKSSNPTSNWTNPNPAPPINPHSSSSSRSNSMKSSLYDKVFGNKERNVETSASKEQNQSTQFVQKSAKLVKNNSAGSSVNLAAENDRDQQPENLNLKRATSMHSISSIKTEQLANRFNDLLGQYDVTSNGPSAAGNANNSTGRSIRTMTPTTNN